MSITAEAVAAPGGRPTNVMRASVAVDPDSKRKPIIDEAEFILGSEMGNLEEGTRARNREIARRMATVEERGRKWQAKLDTEVAAREQAYEEMKTALTNQFEDTWARFSKDVETTFDNINNRDIPPVEDRVATLEKDFHEFVHETVPAIIEEQSGSVTRHLQKSHESFDIDNTKLLKREQKIVTRAERHELNSRRWFETEKETRFQKLLLMGEEMDQVARVDDREEERQQIACLAELAELKRAVTAEAGMREGEDMTILESLGATMERLQKSILENFGVERGDGRYNEP